MIELAMPGGILFVVAKALKKLFRPNRFNWAILGNEWRHLHMHIIPRYRQRRSAIGKTFTDGRWGKNYAPYRKRPLTREELIRLRDLLRKKIAK